MFARRPQAIRKLYLAEARIPQLQPLLKWCVANRVGYRVVDEADLERLAASSRMSFSLLRRGRLIPVPPVDKALRYLQERGEPPTGAPAGRRAIIGTPPQARAGLEELAQDYGAEEVIVVTITFDHEARKRSYTLLAEAFGLDGAGTPASAASAIS